MSVHAARAIRQKHKGDPESVENALSPEQKKVLVEAFEAADKNGDGILSVDEYNDIFQSHGLSIDREWIEKTIARNDKDGDGGISFQEFMEMNRSRLKGETGQPNPTSSGFSQLNREGEKAKLAFNAYDRNRDGYLTKAEFRKTSKKMTEAQIDAVFEMFDKNRDGRLDFEEFKNLMESNKKQ